MKQSLILSFTLFISVVSFEQTKIPIDSAASYIGKQVSICSKVYGGKAFEKVTILNLGVTYSKSPLTVLILDKDRKNFSSPPEELYKDKSVCITGTIQEFKAKINSRLQIIITKPEEMVIYDEKEGNINNDKH